MLTGVAAAELTVNFSVAVADTLASRASVALTWKDRAVVLVGVPASNPVELREKPATAVVKDQVKLPLPPAAASCCE